MIDGTKEDLDRHEQRIIDFGYRLNAITGDNKEIFKLLEQAEQTIKRYKEAIEAAVDTLHSTGGANTLLYRNLQETLSDNE